MVWGCQALVCVVAVAPATTSTAAAGSSGMVLGPVQTLPTAEHASAPSPSAIQVRSTLSTAGSAPVAGTAAAVAVIQGTGPPIPAASVVVLLVLASDAGVPGMAASATSAGASVPAKTPGVLLASAERRRGVETLVVLPRQWGVPAAAEAALGALGPSLVGG